MSGLNWTEEELSRYNAERQKRGLAPLTPPKPNQRTEFWGYEEKPLSEAMEEFAEAFAVEANRQLEAANANPKTVSLEPSLYAASEHAEQAALIEWRDLWKGRYEDLADLHAIPNGELRHPAVAARLKAEGVLPAVPDLSLPVPMNGCHGLYIELKAKGGRVRPDQEAFLRRLAARGYHTAAAWGWASAARVIADYLGLPEEVLPK